MYSSNGRVMKSEAELSEYQKKLERIENVILCVAEAERMVNRIGSALLSEADLRHVLELRAAKNRYRFGARRCASIIR